MYRIVDDRTYDVGPISDDMFGLNFVLTYDMEFLEHGPLLDLLGQLEPQSLRYPGGSVTEIMFEEVDYGDANWGADFFSSLQNGQSQAESLRQFVESAGSIDAAIQLVLPTRIAFSETTGQAVASGSYGSRRDIDPEYFELIRTYIDQVQAQALMNGTAIDRLEIGNEFWGSGRMTAGEYGFLAAEVTEFLHLNYPGIEVIAQVTYSAGVFSPVEDSLVYLTENGDDFDLHFPFQDLSEIEGLVEYTIPGQGSGVGQTQRIASEFANNPTALQALDGIVDHVYFRRGFDGIDDERNHALINIPQTFEDYSGSGPISSYITEWSVRNTAGDRQSEGTNHVGLQYASTTLEAFFEFVSNGVDGANFWPVTFGNESIDRRVLIDTGEQDLTFGGTIFQALSTRLVGLSPVFDYEVEGEIDIHGFSNTNNLVFLASERSGNPQNTTIDFTSFGLEGETFVTVSYLSEDGETGTDINANPVHLEGEGVMATSSFVDLFLPSWAIAIVEVQSITDGDDRIHGEIGGDHIAARGGDDYISGGLGDDSLQGNSGFDTLIGGEGNDTLKGGWGNDVLIGGDGNDFMAGTFGSNTLDGGIGDDEIASSEGSDLIWGGVGDDLVTVQNGTHLVNGGSGDDVIQLSGDSDLWGGDYTAHRIIDSSVYGSVDIGGYNRFSNILDGGSGHDRLYLTDGNDALFLDDQHSGFHAEADLHVSATGSLNTPRIMGFEEIHAGAGDDIIDLTSVRFFEQNSALNIVGGEGNDTIWGADTDETISGGVGDDFLYGGRGNDELIGGLGADTFEFNALQGEDTIADFSFLDGDLIRVFGWNPLDQTFIDWDGAVLTVATSGNSTQALTINVEIRDSVNADELLGLDWFNSIELA